MPPTLFDIPKICKRQSSVAKFRHFDIRFSENVDMSDEFKKLSAGQILARNLREIMDRQGLNQTRIAERGGLFPSQVSETLNLISSPTIETAEKLAKGAGVHLWELLVDNVAIRERVIRQALASPAANDEPEKVRPLRAKKAIAARSRRKKGGRPDEAQP